MLLYKPSLRASKLVCINNPTFYSDAKFDVDVDGATGEPQTPVSGRVLAIQSHKYHLRCGFLMRRARMIQKRVAALKGGSAHADIANRTLGPKRDKKLDKISKGDFFTILPSG